MPVSDIKEYLLVMVLLANWRYRALLCPNLGSGLCSSTDKGYYNKEQGLSDSTLCHRTPIRVHSILFCGP